VHVSFRESLLPGLRQAYLVAIVRGAARNIVSADAVTFVLREYSHCHYVEEDAISPREVAAVETLAEMEGTALRRTRGLITWR
jgi:hypothetical protein